MATKTVKQQIDGHIYEVTQLGFKAGSDLWLLLVRVASPALNSILRAPGGVDSAKKGQVTPAIVNAFFEALTTTSAEEFRQICVALGSKTRVLGGKEPLTLDEDTQDEHFAGRYMAAVKWMRFALEVNYADFFGDIGTSLGLSSVESPGKSATPFPTESTGTPTA